jgi:hypothetical protein
MTTFSNTNHLPLEKAFANPSNLYRGAPFWSWNGKLEKDELFRQLDVFEEMGIGGVTIHCRTGLQTPYLGEEYMELVKACRDHARNKGMLTWLYDEDRWPSGYGGGLVTQHEEYRQRSLLFTPKAYGHGADSAPDGSMAGASRAENGELLARYAINLVDGHLESFRRLVDGEEGHSNETVWYAYLEVARPSEWFNNQTYVDSLNPEAMKKFIEVTHERYKEAVGDSFGTTVPAIFTDEPQFTHKGFLPFAEIPKDIQLPWTPGLDEDFEKQFGEPILDHFPEVVWDLPNRQASRWRYLFHEWVAERFASSFSDQLGHWCETNGLALTGHMMEESSLAKQTKALGDAMRSYRTMQIPGIDMLCDWEELTTAKQAQSAARQYGRPGLMSELYGVTGWDFSFAGHKRQGDWQAALGVLFRVHHLSWYCMRGEAKRDYPASISYQSPWYKKYSTIEDHFARVGSVLSRGTAVCRVGVIHPVESYWICLGPRDTSSSECQQRDDQFSDLTHWLLNGLIDFDFIAESLLPEQTDHGEPGVFGVGSMAYDVVVLPGMRTIRATTLERLETFAKSGGKVLFAGEIPSLVDAISSDRAENLAQQCTKIGYDRATILDALAPVREVDIFNRFGHRPPKLLHQIRAEGDTRYLFVCNMGKDLHIVPECTLRVPGNFIVEIMDTNTGDLSVVSANYQEGSTSVQIQMGESGHLLFRLKPGQQTKGVSLIPQYGSEVARLESPVTVTLHEPNVLLFDKAEFSINEGSWETETQLLDIENVVRETLGLPKQGGQPAQPWTDESPLATLATVRLRVSFTSKVSVSGASFALENLTESQVLFDDQPIDMNATGYFTDKAIQTVALPSIKPGQHTLEVSLQYSKETAIEWMYLLGDFGVSIEGLRGVITEPVRTLSFGSWVGQGLPFYGGNVTYHCIAPVDADHLQLPQMDGVAAEVTSKNASTMVYRQPFFAEVPMTKGEPVDITLYGHRANCFGPVHLAKRIYWLGPGAYRTTGAMFCPEFRLEPIGVRTSPILYSR